jgi:hypothetical protein
MEADQSGKAFILAMQAAATSPGATLRHSDAAGPTVYEDTRLYEQIEIIRDRRLSQFSMALGGIRLAFWGEETGSIGREILIEQETLELKGAGRPAAPHQWNEDVVATSLLSVLDHKVTRIDLTGGSLTVEFDTNLQLRVRPDEHYESWQISSDDHLLIVCGPGGDLTVWYPKRTVEPRPPRVG